jgi:hypothetical protein
MLRHRVCLIPGVEVSRALSSGNTTPSAHDLSVRLSLRVRLTVCGPLLFVLRIHPPSLTRLQLFSLQPLLLQHQLVRALKELRSLLESGQEVNLRARRA